MVATAITHMAVLQNEGVGDVQDEYKLFDIVDGGLLMR